MNYRSTGRPVVHFQGKIMDLLLNINLLSIEITSDIEKTGRNRLLCRML